MEESEVDGPAWGLSSSTALLGNGGSAAIAMHIANDMNKAGYSAFVPDYATLSCFANDYGWESALEEWILRKYVNTLVVISSSGKSMNLILACNATKEKWDQTHIVTFTGFDPNNPIRKLGHTNYWVPSHNYGIVECAHLAILHSIVNPGEL